MGTGKSLKYQIGNYYTIRKSGDNMKDMSWKAIKTTDYTKDDGSKGQRVTLRNEVSGEEIEREQQYY